MIDCQPKLRSRSIVWPLAAMSFPDTKMEWSPGSLPGSTITEAVTVFRAFTTRACGKARWIVSPSESVLETLRLGGKPLEKSSGLETSISVLPARSSAPCPMAATEPSPRVQLITNSA